MRVQVFRTTIAGCLMALAVLFAAPESAQAQDAAQLKGMLDALEAIAPDAAVREQLRALRP